MTIYYRPIPTTDVAQMADALPLAGGWARFAFVEALARGAPPRLMAAHDVPNDVLDRLTAPRPSIAGLDWNAPVVMGILNVTPDSFSDGGTLGSIDDAVRRAQHVHAAGADVIDIGGESTRPGAKTVAIAEETARVAPVIAALRAAGFKAPISVDTRKADVASAALGAGATMINDVSGFTYDPALAPLAADRGVPVCVMHAQGTPETMQTDPRYDDVLLDVYDALATRIASLTAQGIRHDQIIADPGIGFGKTMAHNLALLRRISLFHGLGVPILLGASRKKFIGTLSGADDPAARAPGSIAAAQMALGQGVQMLRVHDVAETCQAIALWRALVSVASHD